MFKYIINIKNFEFDNKIHIALKPIYLNANDFIQIERIQKIKTFSIKSSQIFI